MISLLETISKGKVLVSDGARGTFLHQRGLRPGEYPKLWNITHREDALSIAGSYIDAVADIIVTNSFGGSPIKPEHLGMQDRAAEPNEAAAAIPPFPVRIFSGLSNALSFHINNLSGIRRSEKYGIAAGLNI